MKKKQTKTRTKKSPKKAAKKPATKRTLAPSYRATLSVAGRRFIGIAPSARDAIADLKPGHIKGTGILTIENLRTDQLQERILLPSMIARLFGTHGLIRDILLNQVSQRFSV